ncbi:MAG: response regulator, partial [Fibrobacterota bacterium]
MENRKVLVVEDHEDMRMLYRVLFRREKEIEFLEASNGEEALKVVTGEAPDLVLVDVSLPGMNGIEFTRRLKRDFPHIRVLVVTGHDADRYHGEAMEAGADDLVTKGDA